MNILFILITFFRTRVRLNLSQVKSVLSALSTKTKWLSNERYPHPICSYSCVALTLAQENEDKILEAKNVVKVKDNIEEDVVDKVEEQSAEVAACRIETARNTPAQDQIQSEIDTLKKQLNSLKELRNTGFSNVTREDIAKLESKIHEKEVHQR